jgi:hypothetical protein
MAQKESPGPRRVNLRCGIVTPQKVPFLVGNHEPSLQRTADGTRPGRWPVLAALSSSCEHGMADLIEASSLFTSTRRCPFPTRLVSADVSPDQAIRAGHDK